MRIGYLVSQYPAASHTFIRREVEALRARGLAIDTFSVRQPAADERSSPRDRSAFEGTSYLLPMSLVHLFLAHARAILLRPGAYMHTFGLALRHRVPGVRALIWSLFHFAEAIVLSRELERRRIGRLHNHFANAGANVGFLATRFLRLPWSLTLHGISETDYPAGVLLGAKIEAADFVACVSLFGRAQAMRAVDPAHWSKLILVRCGVDLDAMPVSHRIANRVPRLICVGRLSSEKGQMGLLDAFATLRRRGVVGELVLVGDGPERKRLEQRVAELDLAGVVSLMGRLPEEATLSEIARSDLLVLPSFMEGLPIVLMEAMAIGVPVVASRVAGIPELIEDRREGLLFRPTAWDELADKIELALGSEGLRDTLSRAGILKVRSEFDSRKAIEPLVSRFLGTNRNATIPEHG